MYCTKLRLLGNLIRLLFHFLGVLPEQTIPFLFLSLATDEVPHLSTLDLQEGAGGIAEASW